MTTFMNSKNQNGMWTAAALAVLALAVLWGCTSSDVDDPGADVYLVVTSVDGSTPCGVSGDQTVTVAVRTKTTSANNQFNDVTLSSAAIASGDENLLLSGEGLITETIIIKAGSSASVVIGGILMPGPGCADGLTVAAWITVRGTTVGGDNVRGTVQIVVSLGCQPYTVTITESACDALTDEVTLGTSTPYSTYSWSPGGEVTPTITVAGDGTSVYSVSVVDASGCPGASADYTVQTCPAP